MYGLYLIFIFIGYIHFTTMISNKYYYLEYRLNPSTIISSTTTFFKILKPFVLFASFLYCSIYIAFFILLLFNCIFFALLPFFIYCSTYCYISLCLLEYQNMLLFLVKKK